MSKANNDTLYYYGNGMTRLVVEQKLEAFSEEDLQTLADAFHQTARHLAELPDFQQAALHLCKAWELLGIKYIAPPPPSVKQKERAADG